MWLKTFLFLRVVNIAFGLLVNLLSKTPAALSDPVRIFWQINKGDILKSRTIVLSRNGTTGNTNDQFCSRELFTGEPPENFSGSIEFACECLEIGNTTYQISNNGQILLRFFVKWPRIDLKIPQDSSFVALSSSSPVEVNVEKPENFCDSASLHDVPKTFFSVPELSANLYIKRRDFQAYLAKNVSDDPKMLENSFLISTQKLSSIFSSDSTSFQLDCRNFAESGSYLVELTHVSNGDVLARSDEISVKPFRNYRLHMRTDSIYPHCGHQMKIGFTRP